MKDKQRDSLDSLALSRTFSEVLEARLSRRQALKIGAGLAALALPFTRGALAIAPGEPLLGFKGVPASSSDLLVVPDGYRADVLYAWGDPAGVPAGMPAFRFDASETAEEQALQAGMHHDGMEFFPLPAQSASSAHGLLAINHEYTDEALLHVDGLKTWSAEKTAKSQNAHGVSVIEIALRGEGWQVVRPSRYARRITARTRMLMSGPAAGHALLRTAADPTGTDVRGTFANCACGRTPWGTYLACEENFHVYFMNAGAVPPDQRRYGVGARAMPWHLTDARFDAGRHPNESNRFGWVVEIDPYDAGSRPRKRTALGRFKHEGAMLTLSRDGHAVVYMGDDEAFERIYKFVSRDRYDPVRSGASRNLLDQGTLYAARFDADGSGEWIPLVYGEGALTAANGFGSQADILIRTRVAADAVAATRMDRPEWIAVHPGSGEVYCTLTNNTARGTTGQPGPDPANPRRYNIFGHIIRWREAGGDAASRNFQWDVFVLAGDPAHEDPARRGSVRGDAFGSPDGLWFDRRGVLWIQTDASSGLMRSADYRGIGNNQMLAADPASAEIRRFLVGPSGCEVTGVSMTPDARSMFVNIQHPGEGGMASGWPDYRPGGRPRSGTVVIRRHDGGVIGA